MSLRLGWVSPEAVGEVAKSVELQLAPGGQRVNNLLAEKFLPSPCQGGDHQVVKEDGLRAVGEDKC